MRQDAWGERALPGLLRGAQLLLVLLLGGELLLCTSAGTVSVIRDLVAGLRHLALPCCSGVALLARRALWKGHRP